MATCQGPSELEVEDIRRPRENSVSQPADTAVEDGECLETDENPKLNDENQLAVLDAIRQLGAEMASMKHDLARLKTSKSKRKRHDSSDESVLNAFEEERVLESDDRQEKDNPTPSIDTRIKSLIARKDQTSAADNIDTGGLLVEMDHLHYRLNFDLDKNLKEHHKISNIPKFRCEML
jgi:hypothetical protein